MWFYNDPSYKFNGTTSTHAIEFNIDPDGKYIGTTNGPGKSLQGLLYYNGRITSRSGANSPTSVGGATVGPNDTFTPPWFSW